MTSCLEKCLPRHMASRARLDAQRHLELHGLPPTMLAMATLALEEQATARAVHEEASRWVKRWQQGRRLVSCARDGICEWCLRHYRAGSVHPCMPLAGQADEPERPFEPYSQKLVDELRQLPSTVAGVEAAERELGLAREAGELGPLPAKLQADDAWVGQEGAFGRALKGKL